MLRAAGRRLFCPLGLGVLLLSGVFQLPLANAQALNCTVALREALGRSILSIHVPKREIQEISELRLGTFNTYNLMQSADGSYQKPLDKRVGLAAPILENDLDVVVLQEVESYEALRSFATQYLNDRYDVLMSQGNDARGIQVAYLLKRDLPFRIKLDSHAETLAHYAVKGQNTKIFSRDLPALRVWAPAQNAESEDPLMVLYGTHFKSKRAKDGDPESRILRRTQVETATEIMRQDGQQHPSSLLMIAGDFNGDVRREAEFESLRSLMKNAFDAQPEALSDVERVTHSFHPKDGPTSYSELDAFFVSRDKTEYVSQAFVYRYKDEAGRAKPLPQSWDERNTNPSDHFPVILKLNFKRLLEKRNLLTSPRDRAA